MYSRILVPVDLSDRNAKAVDTAAELAARSGGSALLLHVIEEIEHVDPGELEEFYRGIRTRAEKVLDGLRAPFEARGVAVETQIRMGHGGAEIVRCADEERCDLAVLRSHALDRDRPTRSVGTISHQIALAAPCSVLLVR